MGCAAPRWGYRAATPPATMTPKAQRRRTLSAATANLTAKSGAADKSDRKACRLRLGASEEPECMRRSEVKGLLSARRGRPEPPGIPFNFGRPIN